MRHFEADVEQANQKLKFAAVAITVAGVVMGMLLLTAWWLVRGETVELEPMRRLQEIHHAAGRYADHSGASYPHRMSDLIRDDYLSPDVFGLTDAWQPEVEAMRKALPTAVRYERIGEFFFAPLPEPTGNPKLIFAWIVLDQEDGRPARVFLFDDGHFETIVGSVISIVEEDARQRQRLGLPDYNLELSN